MVHLPDCRCLVPSRELRAVALLPDNLPIRSLTSLRRGPGAATACLIGRAGLAWPPGIHRTETLHIAVDKCFERGALLYIWTLFVLPRWEVPAAPAQAQVGSLGRWAYFLAMSVLVLFIASSRRTGSLPLKTVIAVVRRDGSPVRDGNRSGKSVVVAAGSRHIRARRLLGRCDDDCRDASALGGGSGDPTAAGDPHRHRFLLPASLVLIAGLLVIDLALESEPDSQAAGSSADPVGIGSALGSRSQCRLHAAPAAGPARRTDLQLSESAERGWIGALLRDSSQYVFVLDPPAGLCTPLPAARTS